MALPYEVIKTFRISVTYVGVEILHQGGKSRIIQGEFSSSSDERDWEIVNRDAIDARL